MLRVVGVELPADGPDAFDDDAESGAEVDANALAAVGVIRGTGDRTLDGDAVITRAQLAALAVRSAEVGGRTFDDRHDFFTDDDGNPHAADIDRGAAGGVLAGTGDHRSEPLGRATRGQIAVVAARLVSWLEDPDAGPPRA